MSFPPDDPRVDCGPAECIRRPRDHEDGEHFKWREGSEFSDPSWCIPLLRWTSGVSEELQGPHPGRHQLHVTLWESDADDADLFSIISNETVPPATYQQAHANALRVLAKRLREIAGEMDAKAEKIIGSKSGVED